MEIKTGEDTHLFISSISYSGPLARKFPVVAAALTDRGILPEVAAVSYVGAPLCTAGNYKRHLLFCSGDAARSQSICILYLAEYAISQ